MASSSSRAPPSKAETPWVDQVIDERVIGDIDDPECASHDDYYGMVSEQAEMFLQAPYAEISVESVASKSVGVMSAVSEVEISVHVDPDDCLSSDRNSDMKSRKASDLTARGSLNSNDTSATTRRISKLTSRDVSHMVHTDSKASAYKIAKDVWDGIVRNIQKKEGGIRKLRLSLGTALCFLFLLAGVTFATSFFGSKLTRTTSVNSAGELTDRSGLPIRTLSAKTHSVLTELPGQSEAFLENMARVKVSMPTGVASYQILGYRWVNTSYLVLQLPRNLDLMIAGGKAFLQDSNTGKVTQMFTPASEPNCGRRLARSPGAIVRTHSWASLVERYHAETEGEVAGRRWRRLSQAGHSASQLDMYKWFGAIIASEEAEATAKGMAVDALHREFCRLNTKGMECQAYETSLNPQAPKLSKVGYNKFLMKDPRDNIHWFLYLDLHDFVDNTVTASQRTVKYKLASQVKEPLMKVKEAPNQKVPANESLQATSIYVTEVQGNWATGSHHNYLMPHPGAVPTYYDLNGTKHEKHPLKLAEYVLESGSYEEFKAQCRIMPSVTSGEPLPISDASVNFDCGKGLFEWMVAGWRFQTVADGSIHAFIFANDTDSNETDVHWQVLSWTDGGDAKADLQLNKAFTNDFIFKGCKVPQQARGRRLAAATEKGTIKGTNWCGPGQSAQSCQVTSSNTCNHNWCIHDRFEGDWGCRRHDSCEKFDSLVGVPICACSCDRDLLEAVGSSSKNTFAMFIITHAYKATGTTPCIAYEDTCWRLNYGRRRRWSGVMWKPYDCDNWNYFNKYSGKVQDFGYIKSIGDLEQKTSWSNCQQNPAPDIIDVLAYKILKTVR